MLLALNQCHLGLSNECLLSSLPCLLQVSEHRLGIVGSLDANSHEIVIRPAESSRQGAGFAGLEGEEEEEEDEDEGTEQTK